MTVVDKALNDWTDLKGKIKSKWSKFSDTEVESFKGKMDLISEKIQKSYGLTKEKADIEYKDFNSSLTKVADAALVAPAAEKK